MMKDSRSAQDRGLKFFLAFLVLLPTLLRAAQKSGVKLFFPTQINLVNFSPRANAWIGTAPKDRKRL